MEIAGIKIRRRINGDVILVHPTGARQVLGAGEVLLLRRARADQIMEAETSRDELENIIAMVQNEPATG